MSDYKKKRSFCFFFDLGIYTRVSAYTDWIENVINEQNSMSSNDIPQALTNFGIKIFQQISYLSFIIVILIF